MSLLLRAAVAVALARAAGSTRITAYVDVPDTEAGLEYATWIAACDVFSEQLDPSRISGCINFFFGDSCDPDSNTCVLGGHSFNASDTRFDCTDLNYDNTVCTAPDAAVTTEGPVAGSAFASESNVTCDEMDTGRSEVHGYINCHESRYCTLQQSATFDWGNYADEGCYGPHAAKRPPSPPSPPLPLPPPPSLPPPSPTGPQITGVPRLVHDDFVDGVFFYCPAADQRSVQIVVDATDIPPFAFANHSRPDLPPVALVGAGLNERGDPDALAIFLECRPEAGLPTDMSREFIQFFAAGITLENRALRPGPVEGDYYSLGPDQTLVPDAAALLQTDEFHAKAVACTHAGDGGQPPCQLYNTTVFKVDASTGTPLYQIADDTVTGWLPGERLLVLVQVAADFKDAFAALPADVVTQADAPDRVTRDGVYLAGVLPDECSPQTRCWGWELNAGQSTDDAPQLLNRMAPLTADGEPMLDPGPFATAGPATHADVVVPDVPTLSQILWRAADTRATAAASLDSLTGIFEDEKQLVVGHSDTQPITSGGVICLKAQVAPEFSSRFSVSVNSVVACVIDDTHDDFHYAGEHVNGPAGRNVTLGCDPADYMQVPSIRVLAGNRTDANSFYLLQARAEQVDRLPVSDTGRCALPQAPGDSREIVTGRPDEDRAGCACDTLCFDVAPGELFPDIAPAKVTNIIIDARVQVSDTSPRDAACRASAGEEDGNAVLHTEQVVGMFAVLPPPEGFQEKEVPDGDAEIAYQTPDPPQRAPRTTKSVLGSLSSANKLTSVVVATVFGITAIVSACVFAAGGAREDAAWRAGRYAPEKPGHAERLRVSFATAQAPVQNKNNYFNRRFRNRHDTLR